MTKEELQRLIKVEARIMDIAHRHGLKLHPVEFDIIPPQKMFEIMAYRIPTNVGNWKFGRDYERQRTIFEHTNIGLPYEVVLNSNPARAYLMNSNTFAVQVLVMAHVIGHVAFHTMNKHHERTRGDILDYMAEVSKRVEKYEKLYGIDEVEKIVDAGHSIQFHSSPFESTETENEKRQRIYKRDKRRTIEGPKSKYADISNAGILKVDLKEDIHLYNQKLLKELELKTPVEPTEDLLRYIIDNSSILTDWNRDILEALRAEGQHYWPTMRTRYMNEGFATYWHEVIMGELFDEGTLTTEEHAQYNYANSLVQATNPMAMNPYLIGNKMWKNIVERWDKGRHGWEYDNCKNIKEKEEWDTGDMKGREMMFRTVESHTDWFFLQNYLTPELINELELYIFVRKENWESTDWVISGHEADEIRKIIVGSFAHSGVPQVEVLNGNSNNKGELVLNHKWQDVDLNSKDAVETLKHIYNLWGRAVYIETMLNGKNYAYMVDEIEVRMGTIK